MSSKHLRQLLFAVGILAAVWVAVMPRKTNGPTQPTREVLSDIVPENIFKLALVSAQQTIELALKEGKWVVPSRHDYPADTDKVRALLLKLLDLSASQRVPPSAEGLKKLGLTDEAVEKGSSNKIAFYDKEGKELASLILGERRLDEARAKSDPHGFSASGQYVKRSGSETAYLISLPVSLVMSVANWLDTNLLNIRQADVRSLTQYAWDQGQRSEVFSMTRSVNPQGEYGDLALSLSPAADEEVQDPVLAQVMSAGEFVRISDVAKADSFPEGSLNFDREIELRLTSGLVYSLKSAKKDEKYLAVVSVRQDEDLKRLLESEHGERKKLKDEIAAQTKASPVPSPVEGQREEVAESDEDSKQVLEPLQLATEKELKEIQARYSPWVFEVPEFQVKKFRFGREDILKKKEAPAAEAAQVVPSPQPSAEGKKSVKKK